MARPSFATRFCSLGVVVALLIQLGIPHPKASAQNSNFESRSQKALAITRELSKCKHNSQDQRQFLDQIKSGLTQAVAAGAAGASNGSSNAAGANNSESCAIDGSKLSQFQAQIQKIQAAANSQYAGQVDLKSAQAFSRELRNQVLRNAIVSHVDAAYRYPFANQIRKVESTVEWFCGNQCNEAEKSELKTLVGNYRDGFQKSQRSFATESEAQAELNRKLGLINERHAEIFQDFKARKKLEAQEARQNAQLNRTRPAIDTMVDTRKIEMDRRNYFDRLDRAEQAELQARYSATFYHYTQSGVGLLMYTAAFRNSKALGAPGSLKAPQGLVSKGVHEVLKDTHALAQRTIKQHESFAAAKSVTDQNLSPLLEAFKTNPVAAGQVLLAHPEWTALICGLMVKIESQDQTKRNQGKALEVLAWGGMILGGVLIATGVLSAAGLALGAASASAISTLTLVNIGVGLGSTALNTAYTVDRKNTLRVESMQIQQSKNSGTSSASIGDQLIEQYGGELKSLPSNSKLVFQGVMSVLPFGVNKLAAPLARATTQWGAKSPTVAKLLDWTAAAKTNPKLASGLDVLNFSCGALQVSECEQLLTAFQVLPLKRQQGILENPKLLKEFTSAHFAKNQVKSASTFSQVKPSAEAQKTFDEFDLKLSRVGSITVKDQGKSGTCVLHAGCNYFKLNGDIPEGAELDVQQLDGLRIWERTKLAILKARVAPEPEKTVQGILDEGNFADDGLNTIVLRTPRLLDESSVPRLPAMFQEKQRAALEKELAGLLADEKLNRKEKLDRLDAIMTKYYGKFEFDRPTHQALANKKFEIFRMGETPFFHENSSFNFKTSTTPSYLAKITEVDSGSPHLGILEHTEGVSRQVSAVAAEGNQSLVQQILSKPMTRDEALVEKEAFYMDVDGMFKRVRFIAKNHLGYVVQPIVPGSKAFVLPEHLNLFGVPSVDVASKTKNMRGTLSVSAKKWVQANDRSKAPAKQIEAIIEERLRQDKPLIITVDGFGYDHANGTLNAEGGEGGHAMVIVGAKKNGGQLDELLLLNSWGQDQGNQGYYRVKWQELVRRESFAVISETQATDAAGSGVPATRALANDRLDAPPDVRPSTLSIQKLKQQARDAVDYLNPKVWIERYRESHAKSKREPVVEFDSYEHARNYVFNFKPLESLGFTLPNSNEWKRYFSRLPASKAAGKVTGWEQTLQNGSHARIRLDYSPELGTHYNIEVRHLKPNGGFEHVKLAVPFKCGNQACGEQEYQKIIERMNKR